jgi:hypothetical protein
LKATDPVLKATDPVFVGGGSLEWINAVALRRIPTLARIVDR